MYCVCGKELTSTSTTFWTFATYNQFGKVISGTCIHGKHFPPVELELKMNIPDNHEY